MALLKITDIINFSCISCFKQVMKTITHKTYNFHDLLTCCTEQPLATTK